MPDCYYCKEQGKIVLLEDGQFFCNETEHELWADKQYGSKTATPLKEKLDQAIKKLKEWGKGEGPKQDYLV